MSETKTDRFGRTPEQVAADRQRAAEEQVRVRARTWQEVPKGYYAVPVIGFGIWMDRDCEGDAPVVGYRMCSRTVARHCSTGRVIGKDRFLRGAILMATGYAPEQVRREVSSDDDVLRDVFGPDGDLKHLVDRILLDIAVGDSFRAQYGKLTGRCGHCRKPLTDPKSKLIGIGPDCRGYR